MLIDLIPAPRTAARKARRAAKRAAQAYYRHVTGADPHSGSIVRLPQRCGQAVEDYLLVVPCERGPQRAALLERGIPVALYDDKHAYVPARKVVG